MADQPTPPVSNDAAPGGNPVGWLATTEAGRAKQLLDTHPHLVADSLALRWLANPALLALATAQVAAVGAKGTLADQRPALTRTKRQAVAAMSAPLTALRALLKKKFKADYEAYYPQVGLVKQGVNWRLPTDHDVLIVHLRDKLLPALLTFGFGADPDAGTAVWQPLLASLQAAQTAAVATDATRSQQVGASMPQDAQVTKALRSLCHLAQAHFPDTWEATLRGWGWRKTSF